MISKSKFELANNNMEILPTSTSAFPYVCYLDEMGPLANQHFSWHWHSAFEIDYVAEGEAQIRSAGQTLHLKKGDAVFINSNVMHDIHAWNSVQGCTLYAHIFDMQFLSGTYHSIFETKYLMPILKCPDLQLHLIHADNYRHLRMLEQIARLAILAEEEPFGYEFEIRSELCRFWCLLFEDTAALRANQTVHNGADEERLKLMLDYIHTNYKQKITLAEIAASANISSRECTRCFQRCIGISPVNYLISCRVRTAAQMLLTTNLSITTISEDCGFSSASYFGKLFHDWMGCTPREYRKQQKNLL